MPAPTKPTVLSTWTQGNPSARVQPSGGTQTAGFAVDFRPPNTMHNWLFGILSDWVQYFAFYADQTTKTATVTTTTSFAPPVTTYLCDTTSGGFTGTLPLASASVGYKTTLINIGTNTLTIHIQSGDKLQGVTNGTTTLGPGESFTFACDGSTGFWQAS